MRSTLAVLRDLRRHRLRNLLSAATMFVGVVALVGVSAASSIANDMLLAQEEQAGGRAVTVTAYTDIPLNEVSATSPELAASLNTRLGSRGSAVVSTESSLFLRTPAQEAGNVPATALSVEWDAGDLTSIRRLAIIDGRFPLPEDPLPPTLAINEAAAQQMGLSIRSLLHVSAASDGPGVAFTIAAVVADGESDPKAYANLSAYEMVSPTESQPVAIRVTSPSLPEAIRATLVQDALTDLRLPLSSSAIRTDTTWRVSTQIGTLTVMFSAFAVVMLAVAAGGLLNVGLSSVKERSRELVVRRALGARRRDIFGLVMGSSLAIAAAVAIAATASALLLVYGLVPSLLPAASVVGHPDFPWASCVLGCTAAAVTAAVGAAAPALKAARLPVAQALRE